MDRAHSGAVLERLGGGCAAARFAGMGKDGRGKRQKEWKERVGHNGRWMVEIIISTFKRLLGGALRAVKPEHVMIEMATKIAVYNNPGRHERGRMVRRGMRPAHRGGGQDVAPCGPGSAWRPAVRVALGHEL